MMCAHLALVTQCEVLGFKHQECARFRSIRFSLTAAAAHLTQTRIRSTAVPGIGQRQELASVEGGRRKYGGQGKKEWRPGRAFQGMAAAHMWGRTKRLFIGADFFFLSALSGINIMFRFLPISRPIGKLETRTSGNLEIWKIWK